VKLYRIMQFERGGLKQCEEADPGPPVARQVLVRLHASSLNFKDRFLYGGGDYAKNITGLGGIPLCEGAGVVHAVGPDVTRAAVGDRVAVAVHWDWIGGEIPDSFNIFGRGPRGNDGMLTQMTLLDESELVHLPDSLSFEEAATLPCAGLTAWSALHHGVPLLPGETVLVQGTGGVSVFALQFAKLSGARVIATTTSRSKMDTLNQLGADVVVDISGGPGWCKDVLAATEGRGVDVVIDVIGTSFWGDTIPATRENGRMSLVGSMDGWGEGTGGGSMQSLFMRGLQIYPTRVGSREHFVQMVRAIGAHKLHPVIDRIFDFDDAAGAFDYNIFGGGRIGKIVIRHD